MVADFKKALNYAYLLLKYRSRSKKEFVYRLKRKKFSSSVIEKVLSYLEENNYINDEEFTRLFIRGHQEKGWGPRRISFALKKLGVSKDLIEHLGQDKEVYRQKIREIIERKIDRYKEPNKYQKILRYLIARGFDYEDIFHQLEEMGIDKFEK